MVAPAVELSREQARRIALTAQGFGAPAPRKVTAAHLTQVARRLGAIQIDSVNVLVRSQYLPFYSRLGPYPLPLLDRVAYRDRALLECTAHAASLVPVELQPALRSRVAASAKWRRWEARVARERPGYLQAIEREVVDRGPLTFGDLTDQGRREKVSTRYAASTIAWWRWADGKDALERLLDAGRLGVAGRRGFERVYDLAERVLPPETLVLPTPPEADAYRELVRRAARALGVATIADLADYFRIPIRVTNQAANELAEGGELVTARVEGWKGKAYLDRGMVRSPRTVSARTLLTPFDSLIWYRERTERLFGFHYRIEIYVPEAKRVHGYFVLPFLLGEALVARVDLKADRARRTLLVRGAFAEAGAKKLEVAEQLAVELKRLAGWLGFGGIEVAGRGDLSRALNSSLDK